MVRVAGAALHPAVRRQSGIVAGVRLDGGWTCGRGGDAGSAGDVSGGRGHARVDYCADPASGAGLSLPGTAGSRHRSEEHTSELQSLMRISYAVFCLKKKKKKN